MVTPIQKSSKRLENEQSKSQSPIKKSASSNNTRLSTEMMTPNPENLESLCLTKRRVLEGLKIPTEDLPSDFLSSQMQKDEILNNLNKRILSLKFKIASKTKSTKEKIAKQKSESVSNKLETTKSDVEKLKSKLAALKNDWESKSKAIEDELAKIKGKISNTKDETELIKEENYLKEDEMKEVQKDLKDLKKIMKNMSGIYLNVQGKLDQKRHEINELNSNYFELVLNMENEEELEAGFKDSFIVAARTKQEKEKVQKKFKKLKGLYQKIQKFPHTVENMLDNLKELDSFIESIIDEREIEKILSDTKEKIEDLTDTLNVSLSKPIKILNNLERKSKTVRGKYKENEKQLKDLEKEINKLNSNPQSTSLKDNLLKLSQIEQNNNINLENISNELLTSKEKVKISKDGFKNLLSLNQHADFEFNQLKIKSETISNQLKMSQTFKKNDLSLQEELKAELTLLMKKADKIKSSSFSKDHPDSRKLKNLVTQVTVLHEELMKKDTQIVRKWRELRKSQKESKKIQKSIQSYELKIKQTNDEIYHKFNEQIEKKNKEIDMLKEILKGNANEIKAKEVILSGIKRQLEGVSPKVEKNLEKRVKSK